MELVSVIIPSYNRYNYLVNAINSVKNQTYKNIEIIVVNDGSTQQEYYNNKIDGVKMIHCKKNSKEIFGYASLGYVKNIGIMNSSGNYYASLDDDDIWLPNKIDKQIYYMKKTGCKMSSTEGYIGSGMFNENKIYKLYNREHYYDIILNIFSNKNKKELLINGYPNIFDKNFINIHNCIVSSSVVIEKELLTEVGGYNILKRPWEDDPDLWHRILEYTDCYYIDEPLFYYDLRHGDGHTNF
jgi:glycosyltransferase involved in cell wall biosynthesis